MIKVDPTEAIKNADFVLDLLSELRLNGVVKMSMVTNEDDLTKAVRFFESMREIAYKEASLNYETQIGEYTL